MTNTPFEALDLNLLRILDAIHVEGSVSRAADRLNLSQPAVSHALKRLRQALGDQLFVRDVNVMVPTPFAMEIIGPVRRALLDVEHAVTGLREFEPNSTTRHFTVGIHHHIEALLAPQLTQVLTSTAPNVRLSFVRSRRRDIERELRSGTLDLAIDVLLPLSDSIERAALLSSPLMVAVRRDHPAIKNGIDNEVGDGVGKGIDLDAYLAHDHVQVSGRRLGMSAEDFELSRKGLERTIRARCQTYLAGWQIIRDTDLLLTLPQYLCDLLRWDQSVEVLPCPIDAPNFEWYLYWDADYGDDAAHQWFRAPFLSASAPTIRQQARRANGRHARR